jgi:hypothetical protein
LLHELGDQLLDPIDPIERPIDRLIERPIELIGRSVDRIDRAHGTPGS